MTLLRRYFQIKIQSMIRKQDKAGLIAVFEKKLKRYEEGLRLNPNSIAYEVLIKNTRDYLDELCEEAQSLPNLYAASATNALQNPLV